MKKFIIELDEKEIEMMGNVLDAHAVIIEGNVRNVDHDIYPMFVGEETFLRSLLNKILTEERRPNFDEEKK
jgi:hypothetical protein